MTLKELMKEWDNTWDDEATIGDNTKRLIQQAVRDVVDRATDVTDGFVSAEEFLKEVAKDYELEGRGIK